MIFQHFTSLHVRDLGFWIPRRGFRIPDTGFKYLSIELGFWIPIFSRSIADSLSCISDSKTQDYGFHKQIFPDSGFRKQNFLGLIRNPESGFPFMGRFNTYGKAQIKTYLIKKCNTCSRLGFIMSENDKTSNC